MNENNIIDEKEKINALINKLIEKRKVYIVYGLLGRGAKSPEGKVNPEHNCRDVGSITNDGKYYAPFVLSPEEGRNLNSALYILSARFSEAFLPSRSDYGDIGRIKYAQYNMFCSYCPSDEDDYSELVFSGLAGSFDTRSTLVDFTTIQKVPTSILEQLWPMMRSNPLLIEQIYQTGFPELDSDADEFNGLYRFKSSKILIIEPEAVEEISKNTELPMKLDRVLVLKELSQNGQVLDLGKEVGVGTVDHFSQLKKVANDEMNKKNQQREEQERLKKEQERQAKIEAEQERRARLNPLQRIFEDMFGRQE